MRKTMTLSIGLLLVTFCLKAQEDSIPQKYYDFVEKLDSSTNAGNPTFWEQGIHKQKLKAKCQRITKKPFNESQTIFLNKIVDQIGKNIATKLFASLEDGFYENIHIFRKNNAIHAVFRIFSISEGLNYHEMILAEDNGEVFIRDIYIYLAGEYLSETIVRVTQMIQKDSEIIKHWYILQKARNLGAQHKVPEAYELIKQLPEDMMNNKIILLNVLQILSRDELKHENLFLKVFNKYESLFPNDPSLILLKLDVYLINKQYHKVIESVDALSKAVRNDVFLNYVKAMAFLELEQYDKIISLAKHMIQNNHYTPLAYILILNAYYYQNKFQEFLATLIEYSQSELTTFKELVDEKEYPNFYASQVWKDYQAKQKKD